MPPATLSLALPLWCQSRVMPVQMPCIKNRSWPSVVPGVWRHGGVCALRPQLQGRRNRQAVRAGVPHLKGRVAAAARVPAVGKGRRRWRQ
eukprot:229258-Chlamydomonas_euryale.AAC.1